MIAARGFERIGGELLEIIGELLDAPVSDAPPHGIELEPPVPPPVLILSVSPCSMRTRSGGRPSCSATICA